MTWHDYSRGTVWGMARVWGEHYRCPLYMYENSTINPTKKGGEEDRVNLNKV
jgi:hypothetical protein